LRIVHVDTGRELRGGQRQVLLLAQGLRDRGHEQVVLARAGSPLYQAASTAGLETRPLRPPVGLSADIIHAHDARAHILALPAPRLVVSRRVAFPLGSGFASRWKYRRVARYLAVSEFVKGQLLAAGVSAERISVVYDGVDVGPPPEHRAGSQLVVAPASHDPQKCCSLAAEACLAAGVSLRLSLHLDRDLQQAAVFLYLTRSEGLGSAILLAMARGVPVVASRVGGIPEVVEHSQTGLLVDNDPVAVAAAVRQALDEPAEAARRAERAYAQVLERFSAARMVARTEEAYKLVLAESS
jgi:glycosyltransferase involved in cell wall biosynthesis